MKVQGLIKVLLQSSPEVAAINIKVPQLGSQLLVQELKQNLPNTKEEC